MLLDEAIKKPLEIIDKYIKKKVNNYYQLKETIKGESSAGIINFIYKETIVSRALPSSSVYYKWFTGIYVW